MEISQIESAVKTQLSPERFAHTIRVKDTAVKLARIYSVDEVDVTIASLLHDYAKELDDDRLIQHIHHFHLPTSLLAYHPAIWHGPVGAKLAENWFGIQDKDILHAIYYHTTGRARMSVLEHVVFVADYIEPGRQFPGVDAAREAAWVDLERASFLALKNTIQYLVQKEQAIHPDTFHAYHQLRTKLGV